MIQQLNQPTLVTVRVIQPLNYSKIRLDGVIQFDLGMFFSEK